MLSRREHARGARPHTLQMWDFLIAIIFLVGTVLILGGELFFGHLFSAPSAAIGIGAVLCVLAAIAKDRIDASLN